VAQTEETYESSALPAWMHSLMRQLLTHYTKFIALDFKEVLPTEPHQVSFETHASTDRESYAAAIEQSNELVDNGHPCFPFNFPEHYTEYKITGGEGFDKTYWNHHKTLYSQVELIFTVAEEADVHLLTLGDFQTESFPNLLHDIHHLSLDHPGDNLLFHEYGNFDSTAFTPSVLFALDHSETIEDPFSLCHSALVIGAAFSKVNQIIREHENCIIDGTVRYSITPMPLDLKALQYLYTPRCELAPAVFAIDGETSPSLFNFPIQKDAIFTIFACGPSTLDLSSYQGTQPVTIDAEPGMNHWNHVGNQVFVWGYETHVAEIIFPAHAPATFYASQQYAHRLILEPSQPAEIIVPYGAYSHLSFESFNPMLHHIAYDDGMVCAV
jgi:hypothetical protein